jgi:hypothetical protein
MSLRIRRGTDAQRLTLTFDQGEVVYTTDTKKVYIGDGITAGGTNILANSAGTGVTFNVTTQAFDFSTSNLGLTTSAVSEGANKYFTTQRAQDAAAALFTAVGSPATTGTIAGTVATGTVTLLATPSPLLEQGEKFTVIGTGGGGLTAGGTYYVISNTGTSVVLASSLANAMTSTAITSLTTASLTGTTFSSAGISTGITFTYDSVTHTMTANSTGLTSLVTDTNPSLGGNLTLNSRNITGTGNINITGSGTFSTTLAASTSVTSPLLIANTSLTSPIATISTKLNVDYIESAGISGLNVKADGVTPLTVAGIGTLGPTSGGVYFNINVAKGTLASPTTSAAGDGLGGIAIQGFNGTDYKSASIIRADWDSGATLSDTFPKSVLRLIVGGGGSTLRQANLDNQGVFTAPIFKTGSYTTTEMNAIASPQAGMIIFNTTAGDFYGYNGGAWLAFVGP